MAITCAAYDERFRDLALEILEQRFERAKGSEQSDVPTPGRL